ncbi:MAG: lysine--tRNA ligase [Candidatus Pacearchaeota archaeon]|nr:lysine--tRNA ligase [Candidatus Pacearchaeota archaeon]
MGREDQIISERIRKLKYLRAQGINPYPYNFDVKDYSADLQEKHKKLKPGQKSKAKAKVAGRLMSLRNLGKISFGVLQDNNGKIQLTFQDKETPKKFLELLKKYIDTGDFIGVEGTMIRTQRGELSILVKSLTLLSKSILPLPEKWHGIKDEESRYRKRYLDILMNPEIKEMFLRKSKFWNSVRSFLLDNGFLEVETPVLENEAGGAAATPFATHHNALDTDVYLRISMGELWQKRLMVAGFDKTFEIGRQFRNEGMDADHLQDYTQMEFYWAYADYKMGMDFVTRLYRKVAKDVFKTTKFTRSGHTFDLSAKWKIIDYVTEIKKQTNLDIFSASKKDIIKKLNELHEPFDSNVDKFRLVDILWKHCRRKIAGPAFLTGQPVDITPLAKRLPTDPRKVAQFQIILAGSEVGNGYSELNDPLDQEARFLEQRKLGEAGDEEAHVHDKSFVDALKHGMPPTCGFGFSERLFSFLEGKPIRECVIFPLMKPLESKNK